MVQSKQNKNALSSTEIADISSEMAISDDISGALKMLKKNKETPASCRFYEVQSSVSDCAFGISKNKKYLEMNIDSILSRIVLDMENPRLFIDIADFFLHNNNVKMAKISLLKAVSRLSTSEFEDWRDEIQRRLDDIDK